VSGRQWFDVVIAVTEARQELGLMYVRSLPNDAGMLFPQREPQLMCMWMKNTLIPLNMLFIHTRGRIVCLLAESQTLVAESHHRSKSGRAVLEISGGEAARRGIRVGDTVAHAVFRH
jgi:uncharacterized membrane protein (UPF0127 family)